MDFSTVDRALSSLPRRHPPLPRDVLDRTSRLLALRAAGPFGGDGGSEYVDGILWLTAGDVAGSAGGEETAPERWETLAVGLRMAVDYLEGRTDELPRLGGDGEEDEGTGLGTGGGGVYAEGPRVPATTPDGSASPPSAAIPAGEEASSETECKPPTSSSPVFRLMSSLPSAVGRHVEHPEPRVRSLVAQAVGAHARHATRLLVWSGGQSDGSADDGADLAESIGRCQEGRRSVLRAILASLRSHLEMTEPSRAGGPSTDSGGALDDTTGWRALETNLHALASYVDGCAGRSGSDGRAGGGSFLDEEADLLAPADGGGGSWLLNGLRRCCTEHVNRHVRAAGAAVLGVLVKSCSRSRDDPAARGLLADDGSPLRSVLRDALRSTLADNWSQVRMAGSVLCRRYLLALLGMAEEGSDGEGGEDDEEEEETLFETAVDDLAPMLLPRMCLNRFYIAQGVKLYSQETWRLVFGGGASSAGTLRSADDGDSRSAGDGVRGGGGMGAVARNAAPICRYYARACDADNHAVREAGCQGIAELARKVGGHPAYAGYLSPHVGALLQALIMCFHDESWPVRDEACLACGTFCLAYPDECEPELGTLFERWTEQLTDQIWSVREDAAVALGDAVAAYGPGLYERVLAVVRKSVSAARDQPAMSREDYARIQNDIDAHTNQQLYSCGSLAPKLRKGGAGRIGCSSCVVNRPKAPWEATDGCVYLLRELCARFPDRDSTEHGGVVVTDDTLLPLMTELADVCRLSHYPQSDDLRTTLWRQLPPIAGALGKRRFKALYLDLFVDLLARNLDERSGMSQLSVHAAGQCAEDLASLIGPGVFRGRLEAAGTDAGFAFDRVMEERRRERAAVGAAGRFRDGVGEMFRSPFGPPMTV